MRYFRTIIGIFLCIFFLWFLFRGTEWSELAAVLGSVDLWWLFVAFALQTASLIVRVQRWSYVVRATQPAKFKNIFSATQIALLANSVLPARIGDLTRAYVLARLERIPMTRSLTLVALDRINDVFALLVVLFTALLTFSSQRDIEFAAGTFGNAEAFTVSSSMIEPFTTVLAIALLALSLVLMAFYLGQGYVRTWIGRFIQPRYPRLADWILAVLQNFADGMQIFNSGTKLIQSMLLSLVTWGLVAFAFGALLLAFDLQTPWFGPVLLLAVVGLLTSVTVTPGLVGQYHVAVVAGLLMLLPGLDLNVAKAYAIFAHLVALIPPIVLGVYCMMREDFKFRDMFPMASNN